MLNNSQAVRFTVAAGMYLMLMWGYVVSPSPQWYAAFLAFVLCMVLVFRVPGSRGGSVPEEKPARKSRMTSSRQERFGVTMSDWKPQTRDDGLQIPAPVSNLEVSFMRLESIKSELKLQYAQFGRDQSLINSNGLGCWHGNKNPRRH